MSKSENLHNFESNIPLQGRALRVRFLCEICFLLLYSG